MLTAFFAWGVINESPRIRQVFRDYDQYTRVRLELCYVDATGCADVDPEARPDTSKALSLAGLAPDLMNQIKQRLWVETGLGQRAFATASGDAMEFIVFNRDLGNEGKLKMVDGSTKTADDRTYSTTGEFFPITMNAEADADDHCLVRTNGACSVIVEVRDKFDIDRIPRLVLRAVVRRDDEQGCTAVSNSGEQTLQCSPATLG